MLKIEVITCGYDTEKNYLKQNIDRIESRVTSFKPNYKSLLHVIMRSGQVREYHGKLAVQVFKYLTRKGDNI
jgi:hypothetical protein